MQLSSSNLEILRSRPHETRLHLSVYQPSTVLACRINMIGITKGAREITYNNVSAGSYVDVEADMTMLVGTAAGKRDLGEVRVRSVSSTVITVAENSHVQWDAGAYLTIIAFFDIVSVYPRIVQVAGDPENVIFYKDYDIAYTNQNTVLGSFPCMGSHRAAFLEDGSVDLYWSSSGTYNVKGDSLTFAWEFEGGTVSSSALRDPGYITYTSPGHYLTKLTVSNDSGGEDVSYRYVSIYDRSGSGSSVPILQWELKSLDGSRDEGGYTSHIIIHDQLPDGLPDNAVIVIFADDRYGSTSISLGGNGENNSKIFFVGNIIKDTVTYNYRKNQTEFDIGSSTNLMKAAEGFAISVESVGTASKWYEVDSLSVQKALYHYLRWHTTVIKTIDFQFSGDDLLHQYFDTDRTSIYDALQGFIYSSLLGGIVSDRQGKLWVDVNPAINYNPITSYNTALSMSKVDWMDTPSFSERLSDDISFLEIGGIAWNGSTSTPLMSIAPGDSPSYRGGLLRHQGLILINQGSLNVFAGNLWAEFNSDFDNVDISMSGNYRNLDIAPIERVSLNVESADTNKGIVLTDSPFFTESMTWAYKAKNGSLLPSASFSPLVKGVSGDTLVIPPPPVEGFASSPTYSFSFPPLPSLPPIPPVPVIVDPIDLSGTVVVMIDKQGFWYTNDFSSESPTWNSWNDGLSTGSVGVNLYKAFDASHVSGRGFTYQGAQYPAAEVWSSPYPGMEWELVAGSGFFSPWVITSPVIAVNRQSADDVFLLAGRRTGAVSGKSSRFGGTSAGLSFLKEDPQGIFPRGDGVGVFGNGKWLMGFGWTDYVQRFDIDGNSEMIFPFPTNSPNALMVARGGAAGSAAVMWQHLSIYVTLDNGDTMLDISGTFSPYSNPFKYARSVGITPEGARLMGFDTFRDLYVSQDIGQSWSLAPGWGVGALEGTAVENCGSSYRWIIGAGGYLFFTDDFGTTFYDKTGDLADKLGVVTGTFETFQIRYLGSQ